MDKDHYSVGSILRVQANSEASSSFTCEVIDYNPDVTYPYRLRKDNGEVASYRFTDGEIVTVLEEGKKKMAEKAFKCGDKVEYIKSGISITGVVIEDNRKTTNYPVRVLFGDGSKEVFTKYGHEFAGEKNPSLFHLTDESNITEHRSKPMQEAVKDYFRQNRQFIMTLVFIGIIDHLFLKGAVRQKLQALVEGFLNNTTKMIEGKAE